MPAESTYKLCKRGHVRSPDNLLKDGHCKQCERDRCRARRKDPGYRAREREQDVARHRRSYQVRIEAGLCARCSQPKLSEWYCWDCLNKKADEYVSKEAEKYGVTF